MKLPCQPGPADSMPVSVAVLIPCQEYWRHSER